MGKKYNAKRERRKALREYGIDEEIYASIFRSQGGVCAICRNPPGARRLCVDHDHKTEAVRGLLCGKCNVALGLLGDSAELLFKCISYLSEGEFSTSKRSGRR